MEDESKLNADDGYVVPIYNSPAPRGLQASWKVRGPDAVTL
jgi:hypothetical protein